MPTMYKSDPATGTVYETREVATPEERLQALDQGWWDTPRWRIDPRPNGLSNDNPYERHVNTPFQEFPRTVHKPKGQTLTVKDEREKGIALKGGWSLTPILESVAAE